MFYNLVKKTYHEKNYRLSWTLAIRHDRNCHFSRGNVRSAAFMDISRDAATCKKRLRCSKIPGKTHFQVLEKWPKSSLEFITLDGVLQAPGGVEDTAGGFKYGGWSAPYFYEADEAAGEFIQKYMKSADLLLGRKTFDFFATFWPTHGDLWPGVNDVTKYVMSKTITTNKTDWKNCVFLKSVDDIKNLKNSEGSDLQVHGSGDLTQTLLQHDLVDELWLKTFPITLGQGKKLWGDGVIPAAFTLTDSLVTPNGVFFANYRRAGEVTTGTVGA